MEFPELGDQCHLSSCQQLDFLPFKCQHCCHVYCQQHCQPHQHDCQHLPVAPQGSDGQSFKHQCSHPCCPARELVAVQCPACGGNYCLQHRHPPDHACTAAAEAVQREQQREEQARDRVREIADRLPDRPRKKAGHKNHKLAAKVQLMKLKLRCVQCSGSVLPEDRCYLLVLLPLSASAMPRSIPVCLNSAWTVGKALDAVADCAKISNRNNQAVSSILQFYHHHDGRLLAASTTLAELLASGELCSGGTVVLENTSRGQQLLDGLDQYSDKL